MRKIEIKRMATAEKNASSRELTYDIYIDGKYDTTFKDINDALDYKEKEEGKMTNKRLEELKQRKEEIKADIRGIWEAYPGTTAQVNPTLREKIKESKNLTKKIEKLEN